MHSHTTDDLFQRVAIGLGIVGFVGWAFAESLSGIFIPQPARTFYLAVFMAVCGGVVAQWLFSPVSSEVGVGAGFLVCLCGLLMGREWQIGGWPYWASVVLFTAVALAVIFAGCLIVFVWKERKRHQSRNNATESSESAKEARARRMKERMDRRTEQEREIERQMERRNREQRRR